MQSLLIILFSFHLHCCSWDRTGKWIF